MISFYITMVSSALLLMAACDELGIKKGSKLYLAIMVIWSLTGALLMGFSPNN